ncbi:hypothetical protein Ddc_13891 [Ditylenchus destructor]|nr:hypothetical protein Ddc_13891 [Ditylenchus destructor]
MSQLSMQLSSFLGYTLVLSHKDEIIGCTPMMLNHLQYWSVHINVSAHETNQSINGNIIFAQMPSDNTTHMILDLHIIQNVATENHLTMCFRFFVLDDCAKVENESYAKNITFKGFANGHQVVIPSVIPFKYLNITKSSFIKLRISSGDCINIRNSRKIMEESYVHASCQKLNSWIF